MLLSQSVDGVVCPSDLLAVGVIQAATDLGIRVPDELLVVGYDTITSPLRAASRYPL